MRPWRVAAAQRAHQVPDAEQDGAGSDMAAQAAAVGVEPRPGRDHLHRSGLRRCGASARPSLQKPRPRHSRPLGSGPARARLPASPTAQAPLLSGELREAAAGPLAPKAALEAGAGGGGTRDPRPGR